MARILEFIGTATLFGLKVIANAFRVPLELDRIWVELDQIWAQVGEMGARSLPLVASSGLALGVVMTLHTRSTLVRFGAGAMIPKAQSLSFFVEIGPLVAALLVAGRVGAGIGAVLANMRATEQIDAIEALSGDSFKFLVVPRVVACVLVLPLLTLFMDFCGLLGGFLSEYALSHLSLHLYISHAFSGLPWSNFVPPTLKTLILGFIIGTVS
jgi:phospholipid/cholesterol/gamma-HCH transport system permease protein